MVFSSPLFLFLFLPVALTVYALVPWTKVRNYWLLGMSLVFYAWGEVGFILLLLGSVLANWGLGLWVEQGQSVGSRKIGLTLAVVVNIGLLAFFKYANFAVGLLNVALKSLHLAPIRESHIPLPIGISFFTFHALSYVVDIYRRKWKPAANPLDVALYIFFFPQLVAGPILRWSAIGPQLSRRVFNSNNFAEGVRRFIGGLGKKMLIANTVAVPTDRIFSLPLDQLSTPVAWFGLACYTLQIYFDFSGYSDMAVGLGKMFGFEFIENFNFPYIAESMRDFWRRWHISLSTWFRDYLYVPLGGNRGSATRTCWNLVLVFFLCGLWHGASLTFVVWGLYHGFFLVLERTRFGDIQQKFPRTVRHLYTLLVVMMSWVLFRADSFATTGHFFRALFGFNPTPFAAALPCYMTKQVLWAIAFGILFSGPLYAQLKVLGAKASQASPGAYRPVVQIFGFGLEFVVLLAVLSLSAAWLASGTYNPFIYFRF